MIPELVIPLDPPVQHAGKPVAELRLREPTAKEMEDAEAKLDGGISAPTLGNYRAALVAAVSGLDEETVNLLRSSTMRAAVQWLEAFNDIIAVQEPLAPTCDLLLPQPVTYGNVPYDVVSLREPTVGERRRAETALASGRTPRASRRYAMLLVAAASGVPFGAVQQIPVSLLNAGEAYLLGFIDGGPRSGMG